FDVLRVGALKREQLRQLVDLHVQPVEHLVAACDLLTEKKLSQHKDGEQEHAGKKQRRQCVDEAWPVIDMPFAAAAKCHQCRSVFFRDAEMSSIVLRRAFWSSACASIQSRIICCSLRMLLTSPEIPSASDAMAAAVRWLLPPLSCAERRRLASARSSSVAPSLPPSARSERRSVTVESQFSSSV